MSRHDPPDPQHPQDPLDRIGSLAAELDVGTGPDVTDVRRRARRRRAVRSGVAAFVALAVVAVGVIALPTGDDARIDTADVPAPPGPPPSFAEGGGWQERQIDGVIDRASRPAPVYERSGAGDSLVIVLGPSIPCIDRATCGAERPDPPGDLGFLARRGPLGNEPAVFVPSWTDDLHVGRAPSRTVPGIDEPQAFVGARNVDLVLDAVAADRADDPPDRIVLTGIGGGGIGAQVHVVTVAERFPDTPIVVLIDGMVVAGVDTLGDCFLRAAELAWNAPVLEPDVTAARIQKRLRTNAPTAEFIVVVHRRDPRLTRFLGLAAPIAGDQCSRGRPVDASTYDGLLEAMDTGVDGWRLVVVESSGSRVLDRPEDDPVTDRVLEALEETTS